MKRVLTTLTSLLLSAFFFLSYFSHQCEGGMERIVPSKKMKRLMKKILKKISSLPQPSLNPVEKSWMRKRTCPVRERCLFPPSKSWKLILSELFLTSLKPLSLLPSTTTTSITLTMQMNKTTKILRRHQHHQQQHRHHLLLPYIHPHPHQHTHTHIR